MILLLNSPPSVLALLRVAAPREAPLAWPASLRPGEEPPEEVTDLFSSGLSFQILAQSSLGVITFPFDSGKKESEPPANGPHVV